MAGVHKGVSLNLKNVVGLVYNSTTLEINFIM